MTETTTAKAERNALPLRGAHFERHGEKVMFSFVVDASTVVGPKPATEAHKAEHAGAWQAFEQRERALAVESPPEPATAPEAVTITFRPDLAAQREAEAKSAAVARAAPEADYLAAEFGPGARCNDPYAEFQADMEAQLDAEAAKFAAELGTTVQEQAPLAEPLAALVPKRRPGRPRKEA
jgi:hypothetical protein